ncbi:amidohydrolase family protein [Flavobacterium paronense]|nr:amidohydrolase family protein [Flavobacterium paronense]MDN3675955.1 amidohydrolase family protein [Flavobacterium paronense]
MKFAFFKHRDAGGPLWPDSFAKALTNGNELMSRNFGAKFGLLEAGYKADLTICDYNSPTPLLADISPGISLRYGLRQRSQRDGQWCDGL